MTVRIRVFNRKSLHEEGPKIADKSYDGHRPEADRRLAKLAPKQQCEGGCKIISVMFKEMRLYCVVYSLVLNGCLVTIIWHNCCYYDYIGAVVMMIGSQLVAQVDISSVNRGLLRALLFKIIRYG